MEKKIYTYSPLGNKKRKWKQDKFIISTFNGITKDIRKGFLNAKEAGFNMIELGWAKLDEVDKAIPIAEETDTDLIVQDWRVFGGFQETRSKMINKEELAEYIKYTKKYKCIKGYYVWDEPYYDEDIKKAAEQVKIMEEADEERLPFTVAIPSYNRAYTYKNGMFDEYLKKYCDEIEPPVLSLDFYDINNIKDVQYDNSEIYKDLYLMHKISEEKEMPLWFYIQSTGDLMSMSGEVRTVRDKHVIMQANLALLYGAKGIQYYMIYDGIIRYEDGGKGVMFEPVKALNRKLTMWGRTLMALTCTGIYHSDDVLKDDASFREKYCDSIKNSKVLAVQTLNTRMSVGEFDDGHGNTYIMVMNRDFEVPQTFELKLKNNSHIYQVSEETGNQEYVCDGDTVKGALPRSETALFRIQNSDEEPFTVDYALCK